MMVWRICTLQFFLYFLPKSNTPRDFRLVVKFGDVKHWQHFFHFDFCERIFPFFFVLGRVTHDDDDAHPRIDIFAQAKIFHNFQSPSQTTEFTESRPETNKDFTSPSERVWLCIAHEKIIGGEERLWERRKLRWSSRFSDVCDGFTFHICGKS